MNLFVGSFFLSYICHSLKNIRMKTNYNEKKIGEIIEELLVIQNGVDKKYYQSEKRFYTSKVLDFVGHWSLTGQETIKTIEFIERYIDNKFLKEV